MFYNLGARALSTEDYSERIFSDLPKGNPSLELSQ